MKKPEEIKNTVISVAKENIQKTPVTDITHNDVSKASALSMSLSSQIGVKKKRKPIKTASFKFSQDRPSYCL